MNQYANMGIVEFDEAITNGTMTAADVLPILDARMEKRARAGKKQITKVVEYRNKIAGIVAQSLGIDPTTVAVPVPRYAKPVASAPLPNDAESLIQQIKAVVPAAELPAFIARLATI